MTLKIFGNKLFDDSWESSRDCLIGSSEMATISLKNHYGDRTPIENLEFLWRQKKGLVEGPDSKNPAMIFGNCTEDGIFNFFMQTNLEYKGGKNENTYIWESEKPPYYSCTPDGFLTTKPDSLDVPELWIHIRSDGLMDIVLNEAPKGNVDLGILELKTSVDFEKWREPNIPQAEYLQVMWQLGILGLKWGILYCIVGGNYNNPRHIPIQFDESVFNELQNYADMFREALLLDKFPYERYGEEVPIEIKKEALIEGKVINAEKELLILVSEFEEVSQLKADCGKIMLDYEKTHKELKEKIISAASGATKILYGTNQYVDLKLVSRKESKTPACQYYTIALKELKSV